jgi:hypothetical protein
MTDIYCLTSDTAKAYAWGVNVFLLMIFTEQEKENY